MPHPRLSSTTNCGAGNACWDEVSKTFPETASLGSIEIHQWHLLYLDGEVTDLPVVFSVPTAAVRRRRSKWERNAVWMQSWGERERKQIGHELRGNLLRMWNKRFQKCGWEWEVWAEWDRQLRRMACNHRRSILADPRTKKIQLKSACPWGKLIPSSFISSEHFIVFQITQITKLLVEFFFFPK